jgi:hypothetical protein
MLASVLSQMHRLTTHSDRNIKYPIMNADNRKCKPDKLYILNELLSEVHPGTFRRTEVLGQWLSRVLSSGKYAVQHDRSLLTSWRNILPPFSGSKCQLTAIHSTTTSVNFYQATLCDTAENTTSHYHFSCCSTDWQDFETIICQCENICQ